MSDTDTKNKSWVRNEVANEVVVKVQEAIAKGRPNRRDMQQLMDLIVCVDGYKLYDLRRQGVIRRTFESERLRHMGSKAGTAVSYATDLQDVVNTFWEHVFKYLPRASATGNVVPVRVVDGQQEDDDQIDEAMTKAGLQFVQRTTKCNPVHYLRNIGIMGVRNLLNKSYRSNLVMVCSGCGTSSSVATVEDGSDACPKCKSHNTEKYWPDGNSSYRSRKGRQCKDCSHTWLRQFIRKCWHCGSEDVRTEARVQNGDDSIFQVPNDDSAEATLLDREAEDRMTELLGKIYNFLPADPRDPTAISRTKDVFDILTKPEASKDMCAKCVAKAPLVCEDKCAEFKKTRTCGHPKIADPAISCGAESFTLGKCVNFSKKIGEYHGCSASLAARRVKKVREYVKRYVQQHKLNSSCRTLKQLIDDIEV